MSITESYFPSIKNTSSTKFVVRNIAPGNKTVRVFQAPIKKGKTRDLLEIPGVTPESINASLFKGELRQKFSAKELEVVESDVSMIQFNATHKLFLQEAGIIIGLEVTALSLGALTAEQHKTLRQLIHLSDQTGPGDGFGNGLVRDTLPAGNPFPTQIIWYTDLNRTVKIIEKLLTYTGVNPTTVQTKLYDTTGTLLTTMTDTITYVGPFETTRSRSFS